MKTQKGITLIALIITIVIMLILVGVTVTIALDGDLFRTTQGVAKNTQLAAEDETKLAEGQIQLEDGTWVSIEEYANSFGSYQEVWRYNHDSQTVTKGHMTLNIGDYVSYIIPENINYVGLGIGDANYNYDGMWRVLGVDTAGKLLLVSEKVVTQIDGWATYLTPISDYNTAVQTLNDICAPFADGTIAVSARSINVSDINKLTGYDPNNTGTGGKYEEGKMREYLNKVTIAKTADGYTFTGENGQTATATSFKAYGEEENLTSSMSVTTDYYSYYLDTLTSTQPETYSATGTLYDLIMVAGDSENMTYHYWLADQYKEVRNNGAMRWGIRCVSRSAAQGEDGQRILGGYIWDSSTGARDDVKMSVRAVVTLAGNISFSEGAGTSESPYLID